MVVLVCLVTCTVSVYSGSVGVSGYLYCVCLQCQWQCWCVWLPVLCLSTVAVLVYVVTCTVSVYSSLLVVLESAESRELSACRWQPCQSAAVTA